MAAKARLFGALFVVALLGGGASYGAGVYYEYDDLGRLKSVSYDDGKQIDYELDAAGNRKTVKTWNGPPAPVINDVLAWSTNGSFNVTWTAPTTTVVITRYELYEAANGGAFGATGAEWAVGYIKRLVNEAEDRIQISYGRPERQFRPERVRWSEVSVVGVVVAAVEGPPVEG